MPKEMRNFDGAVELAKNNAEKWDTIRENLQAIRKTIQDRIGEDAVVDTDRSTYQDYIEVVITAHVEDPQKGAIGLAECMDWDTAQLTKRSDGYRLRLVKQVRGH